MRNLARLQMPSLEVFGGSVSVTRQKEIGKTVIHIPGLEIVRVIDKGAHGQVFEAKDDRETTERIFSDDVETFGRASVIIDLHGIASPRVILEGLNAYADYVSKVRKLISYLEQRHWDAPHLEILFERICNVIVYTPLFNLAGLIESLKAFRHPDKRVPRELGSRLVREIQESIVSHLKELELREFTELRDIFIRDYQLGRPDLTPLDQLEPMYCFYDWLGLGEYARIMKAGRKALGAFADTRH